ncbi:MAG: 5-formyltetrahydrofolate cyclo-ligase [Bacteroidales bacterium]|nr:5-formyltetrahydrofolate cyclo-ligase [Bacteroidales bacterium]
MDLKERKKELRKLIRERKKLLSMDNKNLQSERIFSSVVNSSVYKNANTILLYWSMDDEVPTHDFILANYETKTILLPCVVGDDLVLRKFSGMHTMKAGEQFGILEPTGEIFSDYEKIDLMIIPGVAFDREKRRIGRGRGFYDRLLSVNQNKKMGICFNCQLVEQVPVEEFDVKMDYVISPDEFVGDE